MISQARVPGKFTRTQLILSSWQSRNPVYEHRTFNIEHSTSNEFVYASDIRRTLSILSFVPLRLIFPFVPQVAEEFAADSEGEDCEEGKIEDDPVH